jgi:hypothetical protein
MQGKQVFVSLFGQKHQDCHNAEHHGKNNAVTIDGLAFDIDGNLIQLD